MFWGVSFFFLLSSVPMSHSLRIRTPPEHKWPEQEPCSPCKDDCCFEPRLEWGGEESLVDIIKQQLSQFSPVCSEQRELESVLFKEALARGDARAIAAVTQQHQGTWACKTCGCSDEFGLDGEIICGCDSCHKGCESIAERLLRGAKRPESWIKASIVLKILLERCEQDYYSWVDGSRESDRFEVLEALQLPFPKAFEPTISKVRTMLCAMSPSEELSVFRICIVLLESLLAFSETGERVYMFETILSGDKPFLRRLID